MFLTHRNPSNETVVCKIVSQAWFWNKLESSLLIWSELERVGARGMLLRLFQPYLTKLVSISLVSAKHQRTTYFLETLT